ncbi:hypothetical protein [Magnetospirillum sulfuroxidans]|uniref:Uncharacterized protein n=1 Tax=Magnetospirillum sulfuroxidans TaxID=611300 RepID=A0ABS5IEX2_9PROT|nr:hypothetical protein [Magnetospirillum sulfuroxidans]MBR9972965.1 hypothetical protein [Magnetospirillum sulfuroxidans]
MTAPHAQDLAALQDEKKCLDAQLDDALDQYALYEEGMNARFKHADAAERAALMTERNQVEETLGIIALVQRLDEIRELMEKLEHGTGG